MKGNNAKLIIGSDNLEDPRYELEVDSVQYNSPTSKWIHHAEGTETKVKSHNF